MGSVGVLGWPAQEFSLFVNKDDLKESKYLLNKFAVDKLKIL